MSTASPAAPAVLTPGSTTSENALARLAAIAGLAMILGSVLLSVLHPLPDVSASLMKYGVVLAGASATIYGGFRTVLKYLTIAKGYEGMVNTAAGMIPGAAGAAAQHYLPVIEKLIDAVVAAGGAVPDAPAPAPTAIAAAAGAAAGKAPGANL